MNLLRPFVVMTAAVAGPGKLRRIAIVRTNGTLPSRIDFRLKAVEQIWIEHNHASDTFDAALAAADQLCEKLNSQWEEKHSKVQEFTCPKCSGLGRIETFHHVVDGLCFRCDGKAVITRGVQWSLIAPIRANDTADNRRKIDWLFNALPAVWETVPADKMRAIEAWLSSGPYASVFALPAAAKLRVGTLTDSLPKPF